MRKFLIASLIATSGLVVGCSQASAPFSIDASQAYYGEASFEKTLAAARAKIDEQLNTPLTIPTPKDPGGGYTHEMHKANAALIYDAGQLYALTGDSKYAKFAGQAMLDYAEVYPSWGLHPAKKEQSPGRMFWQNLNESMWLLHAAQSYGAIKETLTDEQREIIETRVLREMSEFLSDGSPETFNKVHNHGTWATAAVGLTGYAIGDMDYVEQALLGLDKSGEAGFLKQMEVLFSPDGYYNEGPYYQRFAMKPFVIFAQAVQQNNPERQIFEKRDGILKKAIYATIQQNYGGLFFGINDAIKDKGIKTNELLHAVAIAYDLTGDTGLLSIAKAQETFVLTLESRKLSQDLFAGKATPFSYRTMRLGDGQDGTRGALDIVRASDDPNDLVFVAKNTSQGLGHGHFDKMGLLVFDAGHEILPDYGAARFLNIEAKYGGHYLPENNLFAKQTIAHNALAIDETSHFNGVTATGNKYYPTVQPFINTDKVKLSSASIDTAYEGVTLRRSVAMINDPAFEFPIILDMSKAETDNTHQYDLPFYYNGQLIDTNFDVQADPVSRTPLGTDNGYQYLWKLADAEPLDGQSQVTFLKEHRFYTVTSDVPENSQILFTEVGANDPNFNLRREPAFILRSTQAGGVTYTSVIEPHGEYNPTVEYTLNSHSQIKSVTHFEGNGSDYIDIQTKAGERVGFAIARDFAAEASHRIEVNGKTISWTGPYKLFSSDMAK